MHTALAEPGTDAEVEEVLRGEDPAIARVLAQVEDVRPAQLEAQRQIIRALESSTPAANTVIGLPGPPGAGKSSLAGALIRHWLDAGHPDSAAGVGMVAVDPSSRRSGGALLGDRARLRFESGERVFVRSMASREQLGGLAPATRAAVTVLRAAFPRTLVETVGVGQSEVDVETVADSVVIVLQPGSGDTLQFMKAGLLEIPDVLVVHKWDLGEIAERTRSDLLALLPLLTTPGDAHWDPPVIGVSSQSGEGVSELAEALASHRDWLERSGELARRRRRARTEWILELFSRRYGTRGIESLGGSESARKLAASSPGTALDGFSDLASRAGLESAPK